MSLGDRLIEKISELKTPPPPPVDGVYASNCADEEASCADLVLWK